MLLGGWIKTSRKRPSADPCCLSRGKIGMKQLTLDWGWTMQGFPACVYCARDRSPTMYLGMFLQDMLNVDVSGPKMSVNEAQQRGKIM